MSEAAEPDLRGELQADRLHRLVDAMEGQPLLMVADLVVDRFLIGRPRRVSREAPVVILQQVEERLLPGGGANAAANVRALGGRPLLGGAVGDDENGAQLLAELERRGIETRCVVRRLQTQTPTKTRILGGDPTTSTQQIVRIDSGDALPLDPAHRSELLGLLRQAISSSELDRGPAPVAVLSDYDYGTIDSQLPSDLRSLLGSRARVVVDSRYRLGDFKGVAGATPNQEEAEGLAGQRLLTDDEICTHGPRLLNRLDMGFLLITRGRRGMALFRRDRPALLVPIHGSDQVADVTGAGDTVIGALSLGLAAGASAAEAAVLANYAGGVVVLKAGTATLDAQELHRALDSDPDLLRELRWVEC